jgi:hypothetical protein
VNAELDGYGTASPAPPEKIVTIGVHGAVSFLLRAYLETHTVDVHAPQEPYGKLGKVTRLNTGEPRCVLVGKHRGRLSESRGAALRHEALVLYCSLVDLPGALRPLTLPVPMPPGPWSKPLMINDRRVLFTPDLQARSVSLHTMGSPARLLGEAVEADGAEPRLWITASWIQVFGFADLGADVASAASHIWRAARARRRT